MAGDLAKNRGGAPCSASYAFEELNLHRLEAGVMPGNTASIKVLEKAGFEKDGLSIKNVQINGKWEDHLLFAKVNMNE